MGHFHHAAHLSRRSVRVRASLAPPGKRCQPHPSSHALYGGQGARPSPRSDSRQQSYENLPQVDLIIYSPGLPEHRETVRLALREQGRHATSPMAGVKSISWLNNVWAVGEAVKEGFDEVVMLNERGEVAECTSANIFAVKNEKILTPPLNSGCLEGVTRGILMEIAPEAGVSVIEQTLRPEDLYSADEVFISSTNRNLISV